LKPERLIEGMRYGDNEFFEALAQTALTDAQRGCAAARKFTSCGDISTADEGQDLAELVSVGPEDSTVQRLVRRLLFDRLWRRHSGQNQETDGGDLAEQMALFG